MKTSPSPVRGKNSGVAKPVFSHKLKRNLKVVLFASIGFVILWLITRNQDVGKIWMEVRQANYVWVLLTLLFGTLSHIARAIRWNILIAPLGETPRLSITFYALMTGYLANLAVPRLGEITRCGTLARYSKIPFNGIIGTVVAERVFDMISILILIFLTVIFQFQFLRDFLSQYVVTPLIALLSGNIILIGVFLIVFVAGALMGLRYLQSVNKDKKGLPSKIKRQLLGFWKGVVSLAYIKHKIWFFFLTIVIWFFYFLTVYLIFFALPGTSFLGVSDGFTILALGTLGVVAPVPGGVGTYHFIVITTMTELLGVTSESATSYAYISHAAQMVLVLLVGSFSWMALSLKFKPEPVSKK